MSLGFPTRRLVSQEDASMIQRPDVPRSKFIGQWTRKTTFNAADLVPIMVEEVLPGDHLKYDVTAYVRMGTPLFPLFDNQRIDTFFFFVPNRILWDNWEKFMGQQTDPDDSIAYQLPYQILEYGGSPVGGLADHFGIPVAGQIDAGNRIVVNSLPFRAYCRIWNEWFRDQNLQDSLPSPTNDGPDSYVNFELAKRNKAHDYFTSALPWPQKFTAPAIQSAVSGIGIQTAFIGAGTAAGVYDTANGSSAVTYANATNANSGYVWVKTTAAGYPQVYAEASVNLFRQAFMVQTLLERDARGGTRYVEILKAHFGVTSPDFRLQRPEYIGGGSTPLQMTPIAQTATGGSGLGSLGAAATGVGNHSASYAATEHGYIIGLINVRSELSYSQGLHKMWTRNTRYDFYWPSLAELGEQAILRQEIFCNGIDAEDTLVFGYQERWHEYRTRTSEVTGLFRPTSALNIAQWHLSQQFATAPVLGSSFVTDDPPMARVLAAGSSDNVQYLADILFKREAVRPVPMYGTPATLGRF